MEISMRASAGRSCWQLQARVRWRRGKGARRDIANRIRYQEFAVNCKHYRTAKKKPPPRGRGALSLGDPPSEIPGAWRPPSWKRKPLLPVVPSRKKSPSALVLTVNYRNLLRLPIITHTSSYATGMPIAGCEEVDESHDLSRYSDLDNLDLEDGYMKTQREQKHKKDTLRELKNKAAAHAAGSGKGEGEKEKSSQTVAGKRGKNEPSANSRMSFFLPPCQKRRGSRGRGSFE